MNTQIIAIITLHTNYLFVSKQKEIKQSSINFISKYQVT